MSTGSSSDDDSSDDGAVNMSQALERSAEANENAAAAAASTAAAAESSAESARLQTELTRDKLMEDRRDRYHGVALTSKSATALALATDIEAFYNHAAIKNWNYDLCKTEARYCFPSHQDASRYRTAAEDPNTFGRAVPDDADPIRVFATRMFDWLYLLRTRTRFNYEMGILCHGQKLDPLMGVAGVEDYKRIINLDIMMSIALDKLKVPVTVPEHLRDVTREALADAARTRLLIQAIEALGNPELETGPYRLISNFRKAANGQNEPRFEALCGWLSSEFADNRHRYKEKRSSTRHHGTEELDAMVEFSGLSAAPTGSPGLSAAPSEFAYTKPQLAAVRKEVVNQINGPEYSVNHPELREAILCQNGIALDKTLHEMQSGKTETHNQAVSTALRILTHALAWKIKRGQQDEAVLFSVQEEDDPIVLPPAIRHNNIRQFHLETQLKRDLERERQQSVETIASLQAQLTSSTAATPPGATPPGAPPAPRAQGMAPTWGLQPQPIAALTSNTAATPPGATPPGAPPAPGAPFSPYMMQGAQSHYGPSNPAMAASTAGGATGVRPPMVCYNRGCNQPGHTARQCPNKHDLRTIMSTLGMREDLFGLADMKMIMASPSYFNNLSLC